MPKTTQIGTRIPSEWSEKIDKVCARTGKSRADIAREAIAMYLEEDQSLDLVAEVEQINKRLQALEKKYRSWPLTA